MHMCLLIYAVLIERLIETVHNRLHHRGGCQGREMVVTATLGLVIGATSERHWYT